METGHRNYPIAAAIGADCAVATAATLAEEAGATQPGSTIPNIAAARPIATVLPRTGLAAMREGTPSLTVRPAPGNNWDGRAAIWPAIEAAPAPATGPAVDWARVTGPAAGGQTALEAGTSRGAAEETETHSAEVPEVLGDTTDRARVPAATAVPPAWDREAEAPEAGVDVAAVGGDKRCL